METVLVTNGLQSKSLAVVRSLGKRGVKVVVGERTRFHTSGFSKYAAKVVVYPDPVRQPDNFLFWLQKTVAREHIDVFMPTDDDTVGLAVRHQDEIRAWCKLLVPSADDYDRALDKGQTMEVASTIGIEVPRTLMPSMAHHEVDEAQLLKLAGDIGYPVVVKPRVSSGSRGIRIVQDAGELVQVYSGIHRIYPNPLLQECIPDGEKLDACLCYDRNGMPVAAFAQREIRNFPIPRGPSTVRMSIHAPELVDASMKLLHVLNWRGVADVEFMVDPRDGHPKLLEVNPRMWSSLHLAILCGVDFPWVLYQCAHDHRIPSIPSYADGVFGRSLLPSDIFHYLRNPQRKQMDPPFWTTKVTDDILSSQDVLPTLGFVLSALRHAVHPAIWRFLLRR